MSGGNGKEVDGPTLDVAIEILRHYGVVALEFDGEDVKLMFDREVELDGEED